MKPYWVLGEGDNMHFELLEQLWFSWSYYPTTINVPFAYPPSLIKTAAVMNKFQLVLM